MYLQAFIMPFSDLAFSFVFPFYPVFLAKHTPNLHLISKISVYL